MASKALPNPSEGTTDKLLGQILSALEKQDKIKKNSDKILFYGQEEQTHQDEEHTKQLIETTGGKDKSKTIDEVADFAKEQTLSLKVQEELAEQEAQAKEDEKLFEEVKGKLGQIGESITNGLGNIVDMEGMGAFLTTDEEIKWDKDNGCVYKLYTMSEMSE